MNTPVTSKEAILTTCRHMVSEKGLAFLNMRAVANACGVALGSIYYYFPSKNDLLIAAIESVWEDIFRWEDKSAGALPFPEYIERCFAYIQAGIQRYPNFFTIHSISFSTKGQDKAHDYMAHYLAQIREKMLLSLRADKNIDAGIFSSGFSEAEFIEFILSNLICLLVQRKDSCGVLIELIRRTVYTH